MLNIEAAKYGSKYVIDSREAEYLLSALARTVVSRSLLGRTFIMTSGRDASVRWDAPQVDSLKSKRKRKPEPYDGYTTQFATPKAKSSRASTSNSSSQQPSGISSSLHAWSLPTPTLSPPTSSYLDSFVPGTHGPLTTPLENTPVTASQNDLHDWTIPISYGSPPPTRTATPAAYSPINPAAYSPFNSAAYFPSNPTTYFPSTPALSHPGPRASSFGRVPALPSLNVQGQAHVRKRPHDENEPPSTPLHGHIPKRRKYRTNNEKLSNILNYIYDDMRWTLSEFLYALFEFGKNVHRSERHRSTVSAYLQGRAAKTPAQVLDLWFRHPDGRISWDNSEYNKMYSSRLQDFRNAGSVRVALTTFAVQVITRRLVKEAEEAIKPENGLHASRKPKKGENAETSTKLVWEDIGAATVSRAAGLVGKFQPLLRVLLLAVAERPNKTGVARRNRPSGIVSL